MLSLMDIGVKWIEPRMLLVLKSYKWRRVVVRLPPELDLVFTVNFGSLMFAEAF